jgi:AAA domain
MAGLDAVLAEPDRKGNLAVTAIFPKLVSQAIELRPELIVIDPSADVFGGDEINRAQVRKFVSMLRTLAMEIDCAVLLLSHPSLTGMNSGTGTSGSTAWNNSVRSRLYLEVTSPETRVLRLVKANHGKVGEKIEMRWNDGVYVLDTGDDPVVESLIHSAVDKLFLELLAVFTEQGQNVGIVTGTSYAPAQMAKHPKAKGYPAFSTAEIWTNTSWPPVSGLINPYPLVGLNHFTVPRATSRSPANAKMGFRPRAIRRPSWWHLGGKKLSS